MNTKKRILIVDDDRDVLTAGELLLQRHFDQVITCDQPEHIPLLMTEQVFDAVLLDMNFSPGERSGQQGLKWLKHILDIDPHAVVVMITAHSGLELAIEAMKLGATDFIAKPWQNEKVIATLSAAVQLHQSRSEAVRLKQDNQILVEALGGSGQRLLGASEAMAKVHSLIYRTAPTDANVLILGENGTGKELVARELHRRSLRRSQVFMSVDLGAVSENLFESELFGHKKGAFTGAMENRTGRLVAASGGTLFLDEIGNIPLHLQAKLLTVLEQREVIPLGSNRSIPIDIRVVAATNLSRDVLNDEQRFRQDLLFRLNTVEIVVPPLRERSEDIPEIAEYYADLYARKYRKPRKSFSTQALEAAQQDAWPGNVRALRHAIERAVILSDEESYQVSDLQLPSHRSQDSVDSNPEQEIRPNDVLGQGRLNLKNMEKKLIQMALEKHQNNISKAASELGLTRATLYRRIEKYGF